MNNKIIPFISDCLFVFIGGAALAFVCLRFYLKTPAATIISVIFALMLETVFILIKRKKCVSYALKSKDREKAETALSALCLFNENELNDFFCNLFNKMQIEFTYEKGIIVLKKLNSEVRYCFSFSPVTEKEIIEIYKKSARGKGVIVCGKSFTEETLSLSKRFGGRIKLIDGDTLFSTMKRFELFPPENEKLTFSKKKNHSLFSMRVFCKKNAGKYLLYGILLEVFGMLSFYPVYYSIVGAAFIILSLTAFFFGPKNQTTDENPFTNADV